MRRNGLEPAVEAVERHQQRRDHRACAHRVAAQRRGVDVERRLEVEGVGGERIGRAQRVERKEVLARGGDRRQQSAYTGRQLAQGPDLVDEGLPLRLGRQLALEQQVPDVLERPLLGQLDGRVLAVVVEALLAADVADRRLRDHDAFEALGRLEVPGVGDGLDLRDAHEVAHRHDADELAVAHDGDVPVPVLGEALPRVDDLDLGCDRVGVFGHPLRDLRRRPVGTGRTEAHEVALGEDADRAAAVDHDDGPDLLLSHAAGCHRDRLRRRRRDRRRAHDVGDGAYLGPIRHPYSPPRRPMDRV